MALEENMMTVSLPAGSDLSAAQYKFVEVNSSGQLALVGDGAMADGILQDAPAAAGRAGQVAIGGICKVKCGGTVTRGGQVASDASGLAVNATTGEVILGTALETGATNQIIGMIFHPRGTA